MGREEEERWEDERRERWRVTAMNEESDISFWWWWWWWWTGRGRALEEDADDLILG